MGGKSGGGAADAARQDEQARQNRIRAGTSRINQIFDGGWQGANQLGAGATYDPNATYYNADGSVWDGDPTSRYLATGLKHYQSADQAFANELPGGLYASRNQSGGFNDDFFKSRKQAYIDYANPQLEDQYGQTQKELTFALDRGGLLDSSVRGQKVGELQKLYDIKKQEVADQALSYENESRNAVEDARQNLIATLNATGDAEGAANSAMARSQALSQPAAFSPLSNLFGDFMSGLGTQAALERANYYSGGQTPVRYQTGLFAPKSGSVSVKGG